MDPTTLIFCSFSDFQNNQFVGSVPSVYSDPPPANCSVNLRNNQFVRFPLSPLGSFSFSLESLPFESFSLESLPPKIATYADLRCSCAQFLVGAVHLQETPCVSHVSRKTILLTVKMNHVILCSQFFLPLNIKRPERDQSDTSTVWKKSWFIAIFFTFISLVVISFVVSVVVWMKRKFTTGSVAYQPVSIIEGIEIDQSILESEESEDEDEDDDDYEDS